MGERRWQDVLWDWWYTAWGPFNHFGVRRHWLYCYHCANGEMTCDCGAEDVPYEVSGGSHYDFCLAYNPCKWCGRED